MPMLNETVCASETDMDQKDKTSIEQSAALEALYNAIEKSSAASEDESQSAYREARNVLIRFRKVYAKLPALPSHQQNQGKRI